MEGEHLLVALAGGGDDPAARALAEEGLDAATVREGIERDFERVLAQVGIDVSRFGLPPAPSRSPTTPRWGASSKHGLERAFEEARARGDRRIGPEHILLGLLRARGGTVPRLLAAQGVDRAALARRLERRPAA